MDVAVEKRFCGMVLVVVVEGGEREEGGGGSMYRFDCV